MPTVSAIGLCGPLTSCGRNPDCNSNRVFQEVRVIPRVVGGTLVYWSYEQPRTGIRRPVQFQVQVGRAGIPEDDWEPLADWRTNIYFQVDAAHRDAGFYRRTYYRIAARTGAKQIDYSVPVPADGQLASSGQNRLYREILRREQQRYRDVESPASAGYLLKVRYHGEPCTECTDPDTGLPFKSDCSTCYGVGYEQGYYAPYPCFYADLGPMAHNLKMYEDQGSRIDGGVCSFRYVNIPPVHPWDVWVDAASDHRLIIGQINPIATFGVHNLVCQAAAARLAFDHPAYKIPVG